MAIKSKNTIEEKTLLTKVEIDEFIKEVLVENNGWFDPESLWRIANPYAVMARLDELGCWVHVYVKEGEKVYPHTTQELQKQINENYFNIVQYNKDNKDENFIQDLFLSHMLRKQCYFSKVGNNNVCFILNKGRTCKAFPGDYIVTKGITELEIEIRHDLERLKKVY